MSTITALLCRRAIQYQPVRRFHLTKCLNQERYFTKQHEWVQVVDQNQKPNEVRIGISDYAQRALGDVVYCE